MRKGLIPRVAGIAALGFVLFAQQAQAFTFIETEGALRTVAVEENLTGEVWAHASVESWRTTRNTVWAHCEDVLESYGTFTVFDVIGCQSDVALVNNTSLRKLGRLETGEGIILPLTRTLLAEYQGSGPSVLEERLAGIEGSLKDTQSLITQQGTSIGLTLGELRTKIADQEQELGVLQEKVETLTATVAASVVPATETVIVTPNTSQLPGEARAPPTAELPWWVTAVVLGIYAFLAICVVILVGLWQRQRHLNTATVTYARVLEEKLEKAKLDFIQKPYPFDGHEYWVQLMSVTEQGHFYRTPFAENVKEENLKSHFAHATKKVDLKAA